MRLAFLSPLPPAATGIADYSAEVLELLAQRHRIDVFHDQDSVDEKRLPPNVTVLPAGRFLECHHDHAYDVAVYQMGNGRNHSFLYDRLPRVPGLLVLHDLVLHHARARMFLESDAVRAYRASPSDPRRREAALPELDAYRAEVAHAYPGRAERLARVQLSTVGRLLPYAYPLFRLPVESSRVTAVHNEYMACAIRDEVPDAAVRVVPMPVRRQPVAAEARERTRLRYGLSPETVVVGCFGLMTREKQIETVARAVARAAAHVPQLRLLLVGPIPEGSELEARLSALGVTGRSTIAGRVPFDDLPAHMEAADLVVHLRYPTARETSAALLRVLAQGRPTVISDLEHLATIPDDAVVRADLADEEGAVTRAILRLAETARQRERLGRAARAYAEREHSPAACLSAYEEALEAARARPDPEPHDWPRHWPRADPLPAVGAGED
jgi:glycosyltransferase involved in cell wall biosynthesis